MDYISVYTNLSKKQLIPENHVNYLKTLKNDGFKPKVIYYIGCCVLHWTNVALELWPNATYVVFDANDNTSFLYDPYLHYTGVLSDIDGNIVKFYQNDIHPGGNSYYREIYHGNTNFPVDNYIEKQTRTLDSIAA